ncbi:MAG: hypothetical protein QOE61_1535 [Micromonosporaceae bacterium]|nr:hypothetical protein [Micromonosporaceae bacterium]
MDIGARDRRPGPCGRGRYGLSIGASFFAPGMIATAARDSNPEPAD